MDNPPDREQETTAATIPIQNHAPDHPQRPHLSIGIPASSMPGHLQTPTEADITQPSDDGPNTKRRPGIPTTPGSSSIRSSTIPAKPQRSPSFILRQTVKSLLPVGSFKSSVKEKTVQICRSQSLPMNMKKFNHAKSFKRMNSLGGMFRVVPWTPRVAAASSVVPDEVPTESGAIDGEDIPEEEAVCRICMVELSEGSDTLKLECSCKGELALAHKDCAVKWFSIKGTRTCEVCKKEVRNLPVTLLRVQSMQGRAGNRSRYSWYIIWHGTPILVIVSIVAYFCFLEGLLIARNGIAALAISLPFSCILGLFSSLTTTSMVARRYVWIYAAVQFLFVVFFTHLFYKFLHLQAVISIILATFAGFGVGLTGNSIIVEISRWRANEEGRSNAVAGDVENPTVAQP